MRSKCSSIGSVCAADAASRALLGADEDADEAVDEMAAGEEPPLPTAPPRRAESMTPLGMVCWPE